MMDVKSNKFEGHLDLSRIGGGEAPDVISGLKRDLEGWREILLPLSSFLRWDLPYYPAVLFGVTSTLFLIIWYSEVSTVTAISLVCLLLGVADFVVPFVGPKISGYQTWTAVEESEFHKICENIANLKQEVIDVWHGFSVMRRENSKVFFFIVMGFLLFTAWLGNLMDNLFLTYLIDFNLALCSLVGWGSKMHCKSAMSIYIMDVFKIQFYSGVPWSSTEFSNQDIHASHNKSDQ